MEGVREIEQGASVQGSRIDPARGKREEERRFKHRGFLSTFCGDRSRVSSV